jgi:hypothetical protein
MKNDAWLKYNDACKKLITAFLEKYYPEESLVADIQKEIKHL